MPSVEAHMRTLKEIHGEIEALSEERTELWHRLSDQHDAEVRAEIHAIDAKLDQLWDYLRQRRALRDAGQDPNDAQMRDAGTVERYLG